MPAAGIEKLSGREKTLLRKLAEVYAFLHDLHEYAVLTGQQALAKRTEGVDREADSLREQYPRIFQRYYSAALKRARGAESKKGEGNERHKKREGQEKEGPQGKPTDGRRGFRRGKE